MTYVSGTPADRPSPSDQPLRLIVAAMAGAIVILGFVLALVGAELATPPPWMLLVVAAATAGAWAGAALAPVPRSQPGAAAPPEALHQLVIMRVSLVEAPAILGLVLAFLADPTNLTIYVLPALFALAGMWLFARPGVVRARLSRARTS